MFRSERSSLRFGIEGLGLPSRSAIPHCLLNPKPSLLQEPSQATIIGRTHQTCTVHKNNCPYRKEPILDRKKAYTLHKQSLYFTEKSLHCLATYRNGVICAQTVGLSTNAVIPLPTSFSKQHFRVYGLGFRTNGHET